jgi:thiamine biosynthesis lipoprotein
VDDLTFRAMGSACRIVVDGPPGLSDRARAVVDDLETRWSRFLPTSEVTGANDGAGRPTVVSLMTYRLVEHAIEAQRLTDGVFDPLLLDPLEALGYDRDHRRLADPDPIDSRPDVTRRSAQEDSSGGRTAGPRLTLEPELGAVTVPAGVRFDPGGIGKGLAADIVARDLVDQGAWWVMVGLGGDLRFAGASLEARGWTAVVEDPRNPSAELGRLRVDGGAVATSSRLRRRWSHEGRTHHHLLDPDSAAPATTPVVAATVQASHAWLADVLAKCTVIAGPDRARPWLDAAGAGAILSFDDGSTHSVGPIALLEDAHDR